MFYRDVDIRLVSATRYLLWKQGEGDTAVGFERRWNGERRHRDRWRNRRRWERWKLGEEDATMPKEDERGISILFLLNNIQYMIKIVQPYNHNRSSFFCYVSPICLMKRYKWSI
jgi:hypothetical protein